MTSVLRGPLRYSAPSVIEGFVPLSVDFGNGNSISNSNFELRNLTDGLLGLGVLFAGVAAGEEEIAEQEEGEYGADDELDRRREWSGRDEAFDQTGEQQQHDDAGDEGDRFAAAFDECTRACHAPGQHERGAEPQTGAARNADCGQLDDAVRQDERPEIEP